MFKAWDVGPALALLDAVSDLGCTVFDTAHSYGEGSCERILGRWVRDRGNRDGVVIISKGAHHSEGRNRVTPSDIALDLRDSLARLEVDCIDLYFLHRDDPDVPVGPIMDALHEHVQAGRIGAIGASNWTHRRIREANDYAASHGLTPFVATSPHFSLAEQVEPPWENCVSITGPEAAEAREWYEAQGMPVFSWASLSLGFMSGRISRRDLNDGTDVLWKRSFGTDENFQRLDRAKELGERKGLTIPQVAVAYVLNRSLEVFPIIASASRSEFEANSRALEVLLTHEETAWLNLEID